MYLSKALDIRERKANLLRLDTYRSVSQNRKGLSYSTRDLVLYCCLGVGGLKVFAGSFLLTGRYVVAVSYDFFALAPPSLLLIFAP
jgi:hypothetical protein